jgi:hypothetical protein
MLECMRTGEDSSDGETHIEYVVRKRESRFEEVIKECRLNERRRVGCSHRRKK